MTLVASQAGQGRACSTMGWEQRGNNSYYYKKERVGSKVKSVYVGRGDVAQMSSQIQANSPLLERLARTIKSPETIKHEKAEASLEQVTDLVQLLTQATLVAASFHTHHGQWRRRRHVDSD